MKKRMSVILSIFMIFTILPMHSIAGREGYSIGGGRTLSRYSRFVPRALVETIDDAENLMDEDKYMEADKSDRNQLERDLSTAKSLADDFERGYYRRPSYRGGYDYYRNGLYYVGNIGYTEREFYNRFGYYPDRYRYDSYRNYDYYRDGLFYVNGIGYTFREFYRAFGEEPDDYYNRYYDDYYYDDYYYDGYNNVSVRGTVEDLVYSIRRVAKSAGISKYKDLPMPSSELYDGYYDSYRDRGYYENVSEVKKLIDEAKELANSREDSYWKKIKDVLDDAVEYADKALRGYYNMRDARDRLELSIEKAKKARGETFIRRSYMSGINTSKFAPGATLTRAEAAQIIANLTKQSNKKVYSKSNFSDVVESAWYKDAVDRAYSSGLIKGYPDHTFKPNEPITVEQLIVIAARLNHYTPSAGNVFGLKGHQWSLGYIQTAFEKGWIGNNKFEPSEPITRGQTAQILNRALGYGIDREFLNNNSSSFVKYNDVMISNTYYEDVLIATNTILYERKDNKRFWRSVLMSNGSWSDENFTEGNYVSPLK